MLDAMAQKIPIVSKRNAVRVEQLGPEYPGLFDREGEAQRIVLAMCTDSGFWSDLSAYLADRRKMFMPEATGARIKSQLEGAGLLTTMERSSNRMRRRDVWLCFARRLPSVQINEIASRETEDGRLEPVG